MNIFTIKRKVAKYLLTETIRKNISMTDTKTIKSAFEVFFNTVQDVLFKYPKD
jgi:hypothetical protein